jgi:hypothetical protein
MKYYKFKKVEDEIDLVVAELYGISKEELKRFKDLMNILFGLLYKYIFKEDTKTFIHKISII